METVLLGGIFGLLGVIVGGVLQQRSSSKESERQFERQRLLAAETHARELSTELNRELSADIARQLDLGEKIALAAWMMADASQVTDQKERFDLLKKAADRFGFDFSGTAFVAKFKSPLLFEDPELIRLLTEHHDRCAALEVAFIVSDGYPERLPADGQAARDEVMALARDIELRRRTLLRLGKPL